MVLLESDHSGAKTQNKGLVADLVGLRNYWEIQVCIERREGVVREQDS